MPAASLWHVVSPPNKPALYTATAELTVAGKVVDSVTETFGVRKTNWTGMWTHHALSNQLDCTLEGIGGAHTPLPQGVREPGHPADGTTSEEHLCHFADFMLTCVSCARTRLCDVIAFLFVSFPSVSGSSGFFLNDKPFKILGNANHQDYAAVGVAVPDHLQWNRVQAQKGP